MPIVNTKILRDAKLSASDMALYLHHHGWQELPNKNTRLIIFQKTAYGSSGQSLED